jgi:two-component system chemotaxis response regulator CheY
MIIDDSKTVRSYHTAVLKDLNISVIEAENGVDALNKTSNEKNGNIDLFLVDINMPIMDGYTFVKQLRQIHKYKFTPVIMVTSKDNEDDKLFAFQNGANLFNTKPIKPDLLKSFVKFFVINNKKVGKNGS